MRIVSRQLPAAAMALFLFACAVALPGCGSSSSSFGEQLERLASTTSGASMLVEAWCDGRVPRAYAIHTVEHAGRNLDRISDAITSVAARPEQVQETQQEITELRAAMRATEDALEREDKGAARSALGVLRQLESEARQQTLAETSS